MIIKELVLKNFGKFSGEHLQFGDGINVIYGANEAGKTTIYTAIGAMLFGLDKQRGRAARNDAYTTYQPWENKPWYEGMLRFDVGHKIFLLERNFYHGEKTARLVCETDGEELSVEQGDLEMLLGEANAELFFNTVAVGQLKTRPQDIIYSYLKNYIAGMQETSGPGTDVVKVLEILGNQKKELEQKKKKHLQEMKEQLAKCDARLELLEREREEYSLQLELLEEQKRQQEVKISKTPTVFWTKILCWLKKLLFRKKRKEDTAFDREQLRKIEERACFYKELLGEREILREEILLERDELYQKLQVQPEDEKLKAVLFAMERIHEISAEQKEDVMKNLLEKASKALSVMTKGKYEKLILENGKPAVWDGRRKLQLFQVSTGCADQVYLALRIALQDLFFEDEQLPLIFDDAFVYFDEQRLERLLGFLKNMNRQILLFSCHKREMEILERQGSVFKKILLS